METQVPRPLWNIVLHSTKYFRIRWRHLHNTGLEYTNAVHLAYDILIQRDYSD